jgi:competence protein ComEC
LGLGLGILLKYVFEFEWFLILIFSGSVLSLSFIIFYFLKETLLLKTENSKLIKKIRGVLFGELIFIFFMLLGFLQVNISNFKTQIIFDPKQTYNFTGKIAAEPENRESSKRILFQPENYSKNESDINSTLKLNSDEKIIVVTSHSAPFNYGDKISITGKLQKPENFESDKGIEFDYIHFLTKEKIFYQSYSPQIKLLEKDNSVFGYLFKFKKQFMEAVSRNLPSPQAELVGGILLGLKSSLGDQLELDFRRVGLIHIVVLSGYNITIISVAILAVLFFLPLTLRLLTGLFAIFIFAILVGNGATVIRASLMSTIAIFGQIFHKKYDVNRALFLAGIFMLLLNPNILIYDPSFQLSFLATYGLINFSDKVKIFLKFLPEKLGFREIVVSTVATQIAVFPLLSKMIGEISIVSLIVNVIVLPTIPMAMLLGFLTGAFGLSQNFFINILPNSPNFLKIIFQFPTLLIAFLANLNLSYVIKITEIFAQLPFATISLPKITWPEIALIYCLIIILFNFKPIQISKKIFNVLPFTAWLIIKYKRMFPHIQSQNRSRPD